MQLVIVQLSDMHFRADRNANGLLARSDKLESAVRQRVTSQGACLIVLSGDTAFSGKAREYGVALPFLKNLVCGLRDAHKDVPMALVMVPGNHDCNFDRENDVRRMIIQNARSMAFGDSSALDQCLLVQEEYRQFTADLGAACDGVHCVALEKWYDAQPITLGSMRVGIQLYNSAWLSQIHENPGSLSFPVNLLPPAPSVLQGTDLVVSVIHHPLNWFDPATTRPLSRYLEATSDLILTGHEHVPGFFSKQRHPGSNNEFIEGGVLQESGQPDLSSFNVIRIAMDASSQSTEYFSWSTHDAMYRSSETSQSARAFQRNEERLRSTLPFTADFDKWLHDPGVTLSHPVKQSVQLEDVYVPQDLREISRDGASTSTILFGERFVDRLLEEKHVIVFGPEVSGKTTLAKLAIQQLKQKEITPVYCGADVHYRANKKSVPELLDEAVRLQYGADQIERVAQLKASSRAIVIDDYQQIPLDGDARRRFLGSMSEHAEYLLLLATDAVRLEQVTKDGPGALSIWEFAHLELLEFGFVKRSELCRKWYGSSLRSDTATAQAFFSRVESQLSAVIGEQVIPAFPLFLLIVLQQIELAKNDNVVAGSVGHLYGAMIVAQLDHATTRGADIDTNKNYLAEFAYRLFSDNTHQLSSVQFASWHRGYCERYRLTLDSSSQQEALTEAGLLAQEDQMFGFKYPYHFYYFVAEYFAAHINETTVRDQIRHLATLLHQTQAANIVLFLCYRSRDPVILEAVSETALGLFAENELCRLDDDVKALPFGVLPSPSGPALSASDPETNRQGALAQADERSQVQRRSHERALGELDLENRSDAQSLNKQLQMSAALKTIQIIGQILKNHVGSLDGPTKSRLVGESTSLGLRAMHCLLTSFKGSLEEMVEILVETYERKHGALPTHKRQHRKSLPKKKIEENASRSLWIMAEMGIVAIIKYISEAMGHERLAPIFEDVFSGNQPPSVQAIDLAIRLDHYGGFPEKESLALAKRLEDNPFAFAVIRDLVWIRFYLYHADYRVRQRLSDKLAISTTGRRKLLDERSKKKGLPGKGRFPRLP